MDDVSHTNDTFTSEIAVEADSDMVVSVCIAVFIVGLIIIFTSMFIEKKQQRRRLQWVSTHVSETQSDTEDSAEANAIRPFEPGRKFVAEVTHKRE